MVQYASYDYPIHIPMDMLEYNPIKNWRCLLHIMYLLSVSSRYINITLLYVSLIAVTTEITELAV